MAYDESLANRIRAALVRSRNVEEKEMVGCTPTILAIMLAFGLAWLASVAGSA